MDTVKLPLSGDVTQTINPWTWVFNTSGNNFSLMTVNMGVSSNSAIEKEVLDEVGSYGRQLGRIGEALSVLVDTLDRTGLSKPQKDALTTFEAMQIEIAKIKHKHASKP